MPSSPLGPRLFQLPLEHLGTFRISAQTSSGFSETNQLVGRHFAQALNTFEIFVFEIFVFQNAGSL